MIAKERILPLLLFFSLGDAFRLGRSSDASATAEAAPAVTTTRTGSTKKKSLCVLEEEEEQNNTSNRESDHRHAEKDYINDIHGSCNDPSPSSWLDGLEMEEYSRHHPSDLRRGGKNFGMNNGNRDKVLLYSPPGSMISSATGTTSDGILSPSEGILSPSQLHPLLQIPCRIQVNTANHPTMDSTEYLSLTSVSTTTTSSIGSSSSSRNSRIGRSIGHPIETFCDTGAQRTVMSWEAARRAGILHLLDRRYAGQATGVGSCRVLGRIHAGALHLNFFLEQQEDRNSCLCTSAGSRGCVRHRGSDHSGFHHKHSHTKDSNTGYPYDISYASFPCPSISIIETTGTPGVELLIGLDFLREYKGVLDLELEQLRLKKKRQSSSTTIGYNDHYHPKEEVVVVSFICPRDSSSRNEGGGSSSNSSSSTSFHKDDYHSDPHHEMNYLNDSDGEEEEDFGNIDMSGI